MKKIINTRLAIAQIVIDEELYPRSGLNWQHHYDISESMKVGTQFPKIVVAKMDNQFVLVDGRHRLKAIETNMGVRKYRASSLDVVVLVGYNRAQIYEEAVRRNNTHGLKMSIYERIKIANKLKDFGYSSVQISEIVSMSPGKLKDLQVRRITSSVTGEEIVLKKTMQHLANSKPMSRNRTFEVEEAQNELSGDSQLSILNELIMLLRSKTIDIKNKQVQVKLKEIKTLIGKLRL